MNDDTRSRLEEAGKRPVPGPDPAFADALEARLLAVAASAPPPVPPRRRGPARLRPVLGGLLAGVAALALLVAVAVFTGRPAVVPELTAPVNVEVALRDGTVLEDPDGLRLPEGAVIRVGTGGSARIGDTVLEPGDVATVEQGRLHVEHDQPIGSVSGGTHSASPRPAATPSPHATGTPTRTQAPTPGPTRSHAPTATPGQPGPTPSPTRTPVPTSPVPTPAPTRTATPPTPTPTAKPAIVRPVLRARVLFGPTRIRVTWTATRGAASYVLVTTRSRLGPAPRPRYPGGRILGEFSRRPVTPLRFRVPDGVIEVKLMVVALRPNGTVLARSRIVTLSTVATATTTTTPPATTNPPASTTPPATTPPATASPAPTASPTPAIAN